MSSSFALFENLTGAPSSSTPHRATLDQPDMKEEKFFNSLVELVKRDEVRRDEPWRPENRGALVHRGDANDETLAGKLLYAATHVDKTQRRHIANLIAKERIYRTMFCGQSSSSSELTDQLNLSLDNGDLSFIKYKDESRELNLETLCTHIETLIERGYSLTYIFAYLSYLRRKYRSQYPKFGNQTSAFYRTLIDNYERQTKSQRRIGTDEVYTCEDALYEVMHELANGFFFSDKVLQHLASERFLFTYAFLFMYHTGKRLSELALIGLEEIRTLITYEALVIRIPKCKKLGRITLRGYDESALVRFKQFLNRTLELLAHAHMSPIPFDQFSKRRSLDRHFKQLYAEASAQLFGKSVEKPRGLSLHSLRRFRAASMFTQGKEIDHIRECLDHSSVKVTNTYINKHLMRSYRRKGATEEAKKGDGEK